MRDASRILHKQAGKPEKAERFVNCKVTTRKRQEKSKSPRNFQPKKVEGFRNTTRTSLYTRGHLKSTAPHHKRAKKRIDLGQDDAWEQVKQDLPKESIRRQPAVLIREVTSQEMLKVGAKREKPCWTTVEGQRA